MSASKTVRVERARDAMSTPLSVPLSTLLSVLVLGLVPAPAISEK